MEPRAGIAVIGGSGMYSFLPPVDTLDVRTEYGEPSSPVTIVDVEGRHIAFVARHGLRHTVPPHAINYRANVQALRSVGVSRIIAPAAVGSLRQDMAPGDVVVCDQFIDRTWGRASTFFDGPEVAHLSLADPYCEELRPLALSAARAAGFTAHQAGTVIVTQGPRFSTRAESRHYRAIGGDVLNMTQHPEGALARELGMCYVNVSVVTDYDAGLEGEPDVHPVSQEEVLRVFAESVQRLRDLLVRLVRSIPETRGCRCAASAASPLHAS